MKNLLLILLALLPGAFQPSVAQNAEDNISFLLADGYSLQELSEIYSNLSYSNYKSWLKKKGFSFVQEFESGLTEFKKNEVVSLGVFVKKNSNSISEIFFQSSPQKYYKALAEIKDNTSFIKMTSSNDQLIKWSKNGYVFYAKPERFVIGMYKDPGSQAPPTRSTSVTTSASSGSGSNSSTGANPASSKYDLSTPQKFADLLNANMSTAHIGATGAFSVYDFRSLGIIDVTKRSVMFVEKNGELFIKMNIPLNGDCDYGMKMVNAKYLVNGTYGMNEFFIRLETSYECNEKKFEGLLVAFPRAKADLFNEVLAKFKACCKK